MLEEQKAQAVFISEGKSRDFAGISCQKNQEFSKNFANISQTKFNLDGLSTGKALVVPKKALVYLMIKYIYLGGRLH